MKILAVRGANLASLEGEFALELAEGALARAGVFAICGPTGAGKSTLLDAMCLALYDGAPRLDGGSRVRVGREEDESARITTSDPRSVLRKGAGQGHAEVDFLGVDGRRYRARWEVRRARGKPDGKLQATSMSLLDLEDEKPIAGSRKTDVKEAIEERLGLSFDQFRRSVLLAQGDFAAFLDADAKERAGLLERMTGTEIYGAISMEAHARAGEEQRELALVETRIELLTLLSDDAREELEEKINALRIQLLQDERLSKDAERALAWHTQRAALAREETEAEEAHQAIERQLALWEMRRQELALYAAALPVWPWLEAKDRADAARKTRGEALAEARASRAACGKAAREAEQAREAARARADAAERALDEAGPALAEVRVLDHEIEGERARLASLERKRADADEEARQAEARVEARAAALARHAIAEREACEWLEASAALEPMARRWERNEARLAQMVELATENRARAPALVSLRDRLAEAERSSGMLAEVAEVAARAEAGAAAELQEARGAAERAPSAELANARTRWTERRSTLQEMLGVAELAQNAFDAVKRQRALEERARELAERAAEEAQAVEREREAARSGVEEAARARDLLRATLDLSAHREELREGEACPLCGSRDHPFAREQPAIEGLLHAQDERLRELSGALSTLDARVADLRRTAEAQREAASSADDEAESWSAGLSEARARYAAGAQELGGEGASWPIELPGAPAGGLDWGPLFAAAGEADGPLLDRAASVALARARDDASEVLARLDEEERARRERERAVERARARLDEAREAAARTGREAAAAREAREALARELERAEGDRAERARRMDGIGEALAVELGPWTDWRARLEADPAALASEIERAASTWRAKDEARAIAERAREQAQPALEAAEREAAQAKRAALEARDDEGAVRRALDAKRAARAAVLVPSESGPSILGAEAADERERALREAQTRAREAAQGAHRRAAQAERAEADAEARAARAEEALAEAEREAEAGEAKLGAALAAVDLDEDGARARLGRDRHEIDGWRAELARLDEARARQATVLAERTRKREHHEATDPPALGAEQAREAVHEAGRRSATSRELLTAERARLARDDAQREQASALRARLEAKRERLAVWETLADLVGSANGAKLRVFAQSLTLEILLEHANHHLAELAPRYSLARVPGEDLALMVIDHDMGDDVRAVSSLSGGETFLVALGMAVGLASLSSQRARVDSLFIDEGFGALDPASLDLVLSALDALQATGRQVGLISHVPTIAERFDTRVVVTAAGPARSRVELVEGLG